MKIFYKKDYITWTKLNKCVNKDIAQTYEIIFPDGDLSAQESDCENAIRLWDEKKHGDKVKYYIMCGQGRSELFLDSLAEDYLYKIDEAIGEEKEVVLAIDGCTVQFTQEMVEYFLALKEKRVFRLHIMAHLFVSDIVKSHNTYNIDRLLLPYLDNIEQFDSVVFFNPAKLKDAICRSTMDAKARMEDDLIIEEIFAQELDGILTMAKELDQVDEEHLWLYDWDKRAYQQIELLPQDLSDRPRSRKTFQEIALNDGKETCKRLRELRDEFRRKYGLKLREKPCNYSGECKGSCFFCEDYATTLWREAYEHQQYDKTIERYYAAPVPICGISRLRWDSDGPGIRTLVLMDGCHMSCKHCINKDIIIDGLTGYMFTDELYEMIEKDNLYFEMTGGGVTFGGGEPLIHSEFIGAFKANNPKLNVAVETCLNSSFESVSELVFLVDYWIIDVKDMNDDIYRSYTGLTNFSMKRNLKYLLSHVPAEKILCRVPLIPGFNMLEDVEKSVQELNEMGVTNIERFEYKVGE